MNVKKLQRLIEDAIQIESEFGELASEKWREFLSSLGKIQSFTGLSKADIKNLVRLCSKYLETVLIDSSLNLEDRFVHKASLLFMIKGFKSTSVAALPPTFFSMVNSMAVALMAVAKEDIQKIKRFVKFWIEKLEIEVLEEDEYEYPKFLLRNTLCHIHNQLGEYEECLAVSNTSIKEITAHVTDDYLDEKR